MGVGRLPGPRSLSSLVLKEDAAPDPVAPRMGERTDFAEEMDCPLDDRDCPDSACEYSLCTLGDTTGEPKLVCSNGEPDGWPWASFREGGRSFRTFRGAVFAGGMYRAVVDTREYTDARDWASTDAAGAWLAVTVLRFEFSGSGFGMGGGNSFAGVLVCEWLERRDVIEKREYR